VTGAEAGAVTLHAGCVALDGRGLLILGPSGSGKSALALQLMALGCGLVSDDRTCLHRDGGALIATAPPALRGLIEAWGIGLLAAGTMAGARLVCAVDLGVVETERMPPARSRSWQGISLPLLHNVATPAFPAALLQYLRAGPAG
jgi:HPr kinase/phosphorylase